MWAVQDTNQVSRIPAVPPELRGRGWWRKFMTSDLFQVPTPRCASAAVGVVVNARFHTGVLPTATQEEVVVVKG
jgi:uncharacterized protein YaiE (UPF0345 family)